MIVIDHWPSLTELNNLLAPEVAEAVWQHLVEAFEGNAQAAQTGWQELPSTLYLLEAEEGREVLESSPHWPSIHFALTYPEYIEILAGTHRLYLAIASDAGNGIYLLLPLTSPLCTFHT